MKSLPENTKFAHLGKPGTAFSKGFQRRLDILTKLVNLKDKKILDLGCGEGVWLRKFSEFTSSENVYGSDIDSESIQKALEQNPELKSFNLKVGPAESMDFADNMFDVVFQNEVLEHVENDEKVMRECFRVLKQRGEIIIFTPNSGWPFETHGIFLGKKYYWGNIPFLPWMPKNIYKKFAPHVRNYSNKELLQVIDNASRFSKLDGKNYEYSITYHKHVFPGFDGMTRRFGFLGKILQRFIHNLEKTPLHYFGISHLIIIQKLK